MADFLRIGTMAFNLGYVRQIFEDPNEPGTWSVMYEMGIDPRSGAGIVQAQIFSGEEGRAIKFFVENWVPDQMAILREADNANREQSPKGRANRVQGRAAVPATEAGGGTREL